MSSITATDANVESHDDGTNYLNAKRGLKSWLLTVDHKRIGLMYLASVLAFFLIGGLLAVIFRLELFNPGPDFLTPVQYNKLFTLHGAIMVFLVIIPSVPASLGNFFLPLLIGAKDVAFPKLNLASYYIFVGGSAFLVYSILTGAVDTGWTFYTPYSTQHSATSVVSTLLGVFILGFSSILTGVNFVVTVHKMRAPGMTWMRMPLSVWGLYATALIQILATPVLAITLFLLALEAGLGIPIFDPKLGGDPVLMQHFFWFYSHPAVYIMVVPGFGVISEMVAVHSQKRIFGYRAIAFSSVSIAVIGFLVWGHHMFVSGQSVVAGTIFSFLTFVVAVPTAIKVFSWTATMYKGSIALTTPMCYVLAFLFQFAIGGLTGLFLGAMAADVHLHDTYFVVAHFHYVMLGGALIAFIGALFHWWPKMFGKMYSQFWGNVAAVTVFIGFNVTFFSQFFMGSQGMPRRYHTYLNKYAFWHQVSTIGSLVLAVGFFLAAGVLLHSLFRGKKAPQNPWGGASLEWTEAASPPIEHNFHGQPTVEAGPYEFEMIDESLGSRH